MNIDWSFWHAEVYYETITTIIKPRGDLHNKPNIDVIMSNNEVYHG